MFEEGLDTNVKLDIYNGLVRVYNLRSIYMEYVMQNVKTFIYV